MEHKTKYFRTNLKTNRTHNYHMMTPTRAQHLNKCLRRNKSIYRWISADLSEDTRAYVCRSILEFIESQNRRKTL